MPALEPRRSSPPTPSASLRETDEAVVAARSHGSLLLQMGRFVTKDDLDAEYDEVMRLDFRA